MSARQGTAIMVRLPPEGRLRSRPVRVAEGTNQDYGLWPLVVLDSAMMIVFAASFFHPRTKRDWRALGGFSALMVALSTEMYGAPLTIYLLSGWLGSRSPELKATHSGGHLWNDLIGWQGDPHMSPFHLASYVGIGGGL